MIAPGAASIRAALFDMDGLLIDSEPLWQEAELAVFAELGLFLTRDECRQTMGRRVDEVTAYWYHQRPWSGPSPGEVALQIVEAVEALIRQRGELLPGVETALALCQQLGLAMAIASSSPQRLIEAVVEHFRLGGYFPIRQSAEWEAAGKPHPAVFLRAAERLGQPPAACVVLEDSPNGVRAALAAGMRCVAVPNPEVAQDDTFALAQVRLASLRDLQAEHLLGAATG